MSDEQLIELVRRHTIIYLQYKRFLLSYGFLGVTTILHQIALYLTENNFKKKVVRKFGRQRKFPVSIASFHIVAFPK